MFHGKPQMFVKLANFLRLLGLGLLFVVAAHTVAYGWAISPWHALAFASFWFLAATLVSPASFRIRRTL